MLTQMASHPLIVPELLNSVQTLKHIMFTKSAWPHAERLHLVEGGLETLVLGTQMTVETLPWLPPL